LREINEKYIWGISTLVFFVLNFISPNYSIADIAVGGLLFVTTIHWFIVPFIKGRDMYLPSSMATVFKKGEDDLIRIFLFVLGSGLITLTLLFKYLM